MQCCKDDFIGGKSCGCPTIGQPAPSFTGVTAYEQGKRDFTEVGLADYRGSWLVLFFYPRDFTFICPTEIRGFATKESEFSALSAKVLACSTDSAWSHKNWFERDLQDVHYPVLADTTHEVAEAYGVYNAQDGLAERGLFIIDPEGILRYIVVSSGSVGRSVDETLRVLKALQTGELCPVEWTEGTKTLGKA
ncbi:MAG: peroxiredoxin [bacterium]|nr:peroxiredoxin [bacterium]